MSDSSTPAAPSITEAEWRAPMHPPTDGEIEAVVELAQYFDTFPPKSRWQFNAIRYAVELARLRAPAPPSTESGDDLAVRYKAAWDAGFVAGKIEVVRAPAPDADAAQERTVAALWDFAKSLGFTDSDTIVRAVGPALNTIVRAYGFNVVSIQ